VYRSGPKSDRFISPCCMAEALKDYAHVARPLAAMMSSKRPDLWGTLSSEA